MIAQVKIDSTNNQFPLVVGNLGLSADSLEIVVGDVVKGETFNFSIQMKNMGDLPINFQDGKSGKFVSLTYLPKLLNPGQTGRVNIDFNVIREFPYGEMPVELILDTDDELSPYKFLYLIANIIDAKAKNASTTFIDTVPRIIFNHYNFDFGHMKKGKTLYHAFLFTNMGSEELEIKDIVCSEGSKIYGMPNTFIAPSENGSIVVKINFRSYFGVQHHTLIVKTNDPVHPEIVLSIHGSVYQRSSSKRNPDFCNE